jgi:hypothetical protein
VEVISSAKPPMAFIEIQLVAAQRFALPAGGRDEITLESGKNPKPEK